MRDTARFSIVLTAVCLVAAGGVGGIFLLTRGPVAAKEAETQRAARLQVLAGATTFDEVAPGSGVFAGKSESGEVVGYVTLGRAPGYGGELNVMVGVDKDLRVDHITMLAGHHETPGLGAELGKMQSDDTLLKVLAGKATGETTGWCDRFHGKTIDELKVGAGIDAKTGCTITSTGLTNATRDAVEKIRKTLKAK